MVTIVKHEWHSHDRQYAIEIDEDILSEIYPDLDEDAIAAMLEQIENGEIDVEEVIDEAFENDVEIDWQFQYDDCWSDRKGGYEVTYELGDENSWHSEPEPTPPTHKCTKCKWTGASYDAVWVWPEEDQDSEAKKVCPMCDSDLELTEHGKQEDEAQTKRMAEIDAMFEDEETAEVSEEDLARQLEELKLEFEALTSHTHHCTECDWTGNEEDHEKEGICPNCCAYTEPYEKDKE
jgi:hypothetical protein